MLNLLYEINELQRVCSHIWSNIRPYGILSRGKQIYHSYISPYKRFAMKFSIYNK